MLWTSAWSLNVHTSHTCHINSAALKKIDAMRHDLLKPTEFCTSKVFNPLAKQHYVQYILKATLIYPHYGVQGACFYSDACRPARHGKEVNSQIPNVVTNMRLTAPPCIST